jgi:pyrroline-5-carboxylate reductase
MYRARLRSRFGRLSNRRQALLGGRRGFAEGSKADGGADMDRLGSLGILGAGRFATFLIEGLRRSGDMRPIVVSPRNAETAQMLAQRHGCRIARDNQSLVDEVADVIVATPPKATLEAVRSLRWRQGQLLVCVAIDVTYAGLVAAAPGATVVRAMPTAASAMALGTTPLFPSHERALDLLGRIGDVFPCADEDQFNVASALSVYHLWLYALMEQVAQAGQTAGLPRPTAASMIASFTRSAGALALAADPEASMRLPLDVNGTPGTMTAAGFAVIEGADALRPWALALETAIIRARSGAAPEAS